MESKSICSGLALAAMCTWFTGCAALAPFETVLTGTAPTVGAEVHSETSIKLQEGNFVMVRTNVVGSSKGFKLLGLITLSPATLNAAMSQLYANAEVQLGRPQALAHLMVERSGIYLILFSIPEVTARADLIEFLPADEPEESPSQGHDIHTISQRRTTAHGAASRRRAVTE